MGNSKLIKKCLVVMCIVTLTVIATVRVIAFVKTSPEKFEKSDITEISSKLVRFHVIANSDSTEDQAVKLKVRDAILNGLGDSLEKCKTRDASLLFLKNKTNYIEKISDKILRDNGKTYKAKAMIGNFNFPIKSYGKITLPAGKYTALRVVLGDGDGKNWWCVMFPPLCFIDITRGLTSEETDKSLGKVLNQNEISKITTLNKKNNATYQKKENKYLKPNIEFRFKAIDMIKKLFKK